MARKYLFLLGVAIDVHLDWHDHTIHVKNKLNSAIYGILVLLISWCYRYTQTKMHQAEMKVTCEGSVYWWVRSFLVMPLSSTPKLY